MKTLFGFVALVIFYTAFGIAEDAPKETPVVPPLQGKSETLELFNGTDFKGWLVDPELWSVVNGEIVAKNKEPLAVSTYLLTKRTFHDFRLTLQAKLFPGSDMHSGVIFWGMTEPKQGDPHTYKGHLVMFPTDCGIWDAFDRNSLVGSPAVAEKVKKPHDWNTVEILAQGNRIRTVLNGTLIYDYLDPLPKKIKEGQLGLQLHASVPNQEIHFKNLTLTTFPEDKLTTVK